MGDQKGDYGFATGALPQGDLRLLGFWGVEEISRLSRFELLIRHDPGALSDEQIDALFKAPCGVAMGPEKGDVVRGVVTRVRSIDIPGEPGAHYVVTMEPTASLLTLGRNSRVFQDLTVPEIAASIFTQYGLAPDRDYELRVTGLARKYEFIVQYQESDWDFLQRWFEREGYFYWFEHRGHGDVIAIADDNGAAPRFRANRRIHYGDRNNLGAGRVASIAGFELDQRRIPSRVVVMDYNYRRPQERIRSSAEVDVKRGFGTVISYGEHPKDSVDGERLAALRAERLRAEQRTFTGTTDSSGLRAGMTFELYNHRDSSWDIPYLTTRIEHRGGAAVAGTPHDKDYEVYRGELRCLPASVPFRPERLTPWPRIHGFMHGHVAGDSNGTFAEIDEHGRYKVKLTFDTVNRMGRSASRWIRMAQHHAGGGEGTHHPIRKGAEVMIIFLDGDPDRPVILGAVPNMITASPIRDLTETQAVMKTPSGIRVEIEDNAARRGS